MKKIFLLTCILLLLAVPVAAEDEQSLLDGMDYIGDSCVNVGYLQLNLGDLGPAITAAGYPELPEGLLVYGGGTVMGFRDGLRWGGYAISGEAKRKGANDALSYIKFSLGGGVLDYGFVLTDRFDVGVGIMLGGGGYELTLRDQAVANLSQTNKIAVKNAFFLTGPRVNADYQLTDWLMMQANATYLYGLGDKRWDDLGLKTGNIPSLRVNGLLATLNFIMTF